ncbi:MAG: hypothetical protein Q8M16_11060 [Pirellulaceae bacterium]|nr:hypothetical protein [Pirellulaceae bacterium]
MVALHRAAYLADKHPDSRILLTTFNSLLAASLKLKLRHLIGHKPKAMERMEVFSLWNGRMSTEIILIWGS